MLGVGDCVTDHVLQEGLEDAAGLLVDEARDTLDSPSAGETTDGWLGDALDVVSQDLPVTLGASFPESFASFSAARHGEKISLLLGSNDDGFRSSVLLPHAAAGPHRIFGRTIFVRRRIK